MKRLAPLILSLVLALPPAAALAAGAPDRARALKDDPQVLARDALKALGPAFVEVERPTFSGMFGQQPITSLMFATRPWVSGHPGLCEATVAWVSIGWSADAERPGAPLGSSQAYKVVGSLEPAKKGHRDKPANCRIAGRVLPTESADMGQVGFFRADDDYAAWQGARVLQHAIDAAGGPVVPTCVSISDKGPERCAQPVATLAGLKLASLMSVSRKPCPDAPELTCVEGEFLQAGGANEQSVWTVRVRALLQNGQDYGPRNPPSAPDDLDLLEIRAMALEFTITAYD
ncbi:hypothetical protein QO010_003510 [Caulobacter ginsengisoli]|uniref:Uncharacterized protein n=1 Tax=Caulobacter ginsengisoli TaxID=400775 RepID=A0ABU0IX02_9CAUL|nr:hypothetical protein [Caulobacter ginsengisoli]MDQ0465718.1 hypothetical protein [Caulobacter ginsengisoli]